MEKVKYGGWSSCVRLANDKVEMVVTTEVGPRIIRFGFVGGENELKEFPEMLGRTGDAEWRVYGGHRLWHAPEQMPRSYVPDNAPVRVKETKSGVRLTQAVEAETGIEKEMEVSVSLSGARGRVTHRVTNRGVWPVELAPWALTVLAPGGRAIIPLPPRGSHEENLAPANTLTLWAYTDMTDARWTWGEKFILLRQDPQASKPQKVGVMVPAGWAAYVRGGRLFVKTFRYVAGAHYPDWGCSVETFTNKDMLELETLAPVAKLDPGASAEHHENWFLFDNVPVPECDADVEKHVLPRVNKVLSAK